MENSGSSPAKRRKPSRQPTNAAQLLRYALESIDDETLARAVGVPVERLRRWASRSHTMTLGERAALAVAIIALAPPSSSLMSGAATLREQVRTAVEYQLGVTRATEQAPRLAFALGHDR